jgi:hypothetical protein
LICFLGNSCKLKFDWSTIKSPVTNIDISVSHDQSCHNIMQILLFSNCSVPVYLL